MADDKKIINTDYQAIFDASPDVTFILSTMGQILYANRTAIHRYGYDVEKLLQMNISDLSPPESSKQVSIPLRMSNKSGEMFEGSHRCKDGSEFPVEIFTQQIILKGETVVLSTVCDIIRRRALESELQGKKYLFNRILNPNLGTVYVYDLITQEYVYLNQRFLTKFDTAAKETLNKGPRLNKNIHPDDLPNVNTSNNAWRIAVDDDIRTNEYRILNIKGDYIWLMSHEAPFARDKSGQVSQVLGIAHDITSQKRSEALLKGQKQVLEMIAKSYPLSETLTVLVRLIEDQSPGMLGSILLLDQDGGHVCHCAAPSLPAEFVAAIDGQPIGPSAGSCGTALYRKEAVFVEDIATDPLWASYKVAALLHNLRACWSTPILDENDGVQGSFAMYYQEPGLPIAEHIKLIEAATHLAGIAISRHQAFQSLVAAEERLKLFILNAPSAIAMFDRDMRYVNYSLRWLKDYSLVGQELTGRSYYEVFNDIPDHWKKAHQRSLAGKIERGEEDTFLRVDGTIEVVRWETHPWRTSEGKIGGIIIFSEVITERKTAENKLQVSEKRLRDLIDGLGPSLFVGLLTLRGMVIEANRSALEAAGLKLEEVLGKPVENTYWFAYSKEVQRQIRNAVRLAARGESSRFDIRIRASEEQFVDIDFSLQPLRDETGQVVFLVPSASVITERKQAEQRIVRLTHIYKALSEINHAIVRMDQQKDLFPLVCRCAVDFGGMKLAWVGQVDKLSGIIMPIADYGDMTGYLNSIRVSSHSDVPEGCGVTGTAFRENRPVIVNDYLNDPMTASWRERAASIGWASAAAFPIGREGKPFAVLTVCHAQPDAFDKETITLLEEMSVNISFALDNFDHELQRKAGEKSLRLAASVYETSREGIIVTNANNQIIAVNPAFTMITGYAEEEVLGKNPGLGQHNEAFYEAMWQEVNTTGHWKGEIWNERKSGKLYPNLVTINNVLNEDGTVQRRVVTFTDVSQKREAEQIIWHQANFDMLTNLPNRQMFHDRLDQEIKKANRASRPLVLMLLDLDRFKEVNDTLGHDMGDVLLKETAHRLNDCIRESDTVARLGGDEFTIILSELDDSSSVDRVAQKVLQKLSEPFMLGNEVTYVSASIGITLYPEDATEMEALLKNADQAMYSAKSMGRNRYSYFTPSMQHKAQARMRMANDLRKALGDNQLWIAYQPIVELATGIIHKAEALLRWQHPQLGLISPAEFIPIAEDTGLINSIGDWVFRESSRQVKRWRTLLHPEFQISVNKSPVQFHSEKTHLAWYDYLEQLGLPGQSIAVEITEGLLLEADTLVSKRLLEFRDAGMQVSLDDFGTGYSALSYLKKFKIDYIKIDQSFTRNLADGSDDLVLCEAIIMMAHKLNMKVIAEGVETLEQRDLLIAAGCDYGQGYFFSRPVRANEFESLLSK